MKHRFLPMIALLLVAPMSHAMFMRPQIESVPIGRLLTNLQQRLATNSQDVEALYHLARVHSMAYATNTTEVIVMKNGGDPYFGYGYDTGVPRKTFSPATARARVESLQHLTNAILYYERAAKLVFKGTNATAHRWLIVPIHLGLAWCLEQSGRRNDAIEAYRDSLQFAWRQEVDPEITLSQRAHWSWDQLRNGKNPLSKPPKKSYLGPGVCYSDEIIGYLLALLDPKKDEKEIAQLQADRKTLRSLGRAVTPLLVPLNDAPLDELVDARANVAFDLDGSGERRRWGWITTNAAWLVFDPSGKGKINSALELFGNVTFWVFWRDGYDALSSLDDNGDGQISGGESNGLALWCDRNSNGVSEPGEVIPLSKLGIMAIKCRSETHSSGILFNPHGVVFRDGTSRATYDWISSADDTHGNVASR